MNDEKIIPKTDEVTAHGEVSNDAIKSTPISPPTPEVGGDLVHTSSDLHGDIARILKGLKLPERRGLAETIPQSEEKVVPVTPPIKTETPPPQDGHLTSVHTFRDDLTRVARDQKISVIKAASLEEEKRHRDKPQDFDTAVKSHSMRPYFFFGVALIVAGVIALFAIQFSSPTQQAAQQYADTSLMFSEQNNTFLLSQETGIDIKRTLAEVRKQNYTLGSVLQIIPLISGDIPRRATTQEFLTKLDIHAPDLLINALGDRFFLGIHVVDTNAPVLIFSVTSYENAFAGMLAWESSLNDDLSPFYSSVPPFTSQSGAPTRRAFTDEVIKNYDIRALRDDAGKIMMYYAFPSRNILIIAESPYSFTEAITRLKAQRSL